MKCPHDRVTLEIPEVAYRNRKLLDCAHIMHDCTIQIPGVCRGYSVEGLEPAHGPKSWLNGGGAHKSDDVFAAACHECHVELDQGRHTTREEKDWYWGRGAARTWSWLMQHGKLVLGG